MSNPNKEPKRLEEKQEVESSKKALLEDLGTDIDAQIDEAIAVEEWAMANNITLE